MSSVVLIVGAPTQEVIVAHQPQSLDTDLATMIQQTSSALRAAVVGLSGSKAAAQDDSTATTIAELKDDFNALLADLRTAGIIAS